MSSWDILSFSDRLDWFKDVSRGRQHLMLRFARERKVLNFNPPPGWRQAYRHPTRLYKIQENLWHFEWGRLFPFFRRPLVAVRTTAFLRGLCVRWLRLRLGIQEYIHLVWGPTQARVLQGLPRGFTVYYAYDQFDHFYHEKREWFEETVANERVLSHISDMAFGVSVPITESLREKGFKKVVYAPNAVDWDRFSSVFDSRVPDDLVGIPRPRLCYVGGLYHKTDFAILNHISESLNRCSLVLIGNVSSTMEDPKRTSLGALLNRPNVFVLGRRAPHEIPLYLASVDIGLAPFDMRGDAYFCSPLKVYEYLAAALPVVASPVPEVLKMGNLVYTAHSSEEWVSQIERALREDCPELRRQRREFAQQHSWDNRAKQVIEHIEQAYQEWKGGQS